MVGAIVGMIAFQLLSLAARWRGAYRARKRAHIDTVRVRRNAARFY